MGCCSREKKEKSCGRKLCGFLVTLLLICTAAILCWYFLAFARDVESSIGSCDGCYCIPDNSTGFSCPSQDESTMPPSSYPEETINQWKSQTILNPYTLNCNPYTDGGLCDTEPPLDPNLEWAALGETAVCAIHYEPELQSRGLQSDDLVDNTTEIVSSPLETFTCEDTDTNFYRIKTYPSSEAAEQAGGFVTHVGSCGVCSTLQDLAV